MRALVTGADGFIGSHLVERLLDSGYDVRAFALYNSFNTWGWLDSIDGIDHVEVVTGDIRDAACCRAAAKDVDVVFHLASLIAIPYSYVAVDSYLETNIRGAMNICQAALEAGVSRVVHTSTSEVYGTAMYVPIDEKHPLQPQSPYSATKIGADALALSYHHAFELPVTVARPFNTFGPRQSARAVIPTIISQLAAGAERVRLGSTVPRRDFNFVEDTCAGLIAIGENEAGIGDVFNIGSGRDVSVAEVFDIIAGLMGSDAVVESDDDRLRPEGSEVYRLLCDHTKLTEAVGWRPAVTLEEGLGRTIDWFTDPANLSRYRIGEYVV